jgi:phosphatidylglycerol:prolipoprotein diacylglycerol transferase
MTGELFSFELWGRTFTIYFYGVFLLLAVVVGILILYRELSRRELETKRILDNIFWILLFGIVGARLGYVLLHLDFYARNPSEIFLIWQGGLNFTGGLIFGFVTAFVWLYLKNRRELY